MDEMTRVGWSREEVASALVEVADQQMLAAIAKRATKSEITRHLKRPLVVDGSLIVLRARIARPSDEFQRCQDTLRTSMQAKLFQGFIMHPKVCRCGSFSVT